LLTIDSKATDNQTAENSRLLLFDPNNGQLVFEQRIVINRESEEILKQQNINHIQGKILSETASKPRFLAVHNDNIYIADLGKKRRFYMNKIKISLGRSLIYGTSIRNEFEFSCTTIFGGQGRANGEMIDPSGLFIDSGGNIISADSKNDRIQVFSSDGAYRTTLKLNERIKRPSGICTNRSGTQFYISCYLAGCVRAFHISY
jgi:DNA-binding beta-propeller fold protein YncE